MKLSKNVFYKKCGPKLIFFNDLKKYIPIFFDIENWLWKSDFWTFWQILSTWWKFSLADIKKNILQEWSMEKNLSCISCAAWNVFPINSLLPLHCLIATTWWLPEKLKNNNGFLRSKWIFRSAKERASVLVCLTFNNNERCARLNWPKIILKSHSNLKIFTYTTFS